MRLLVYAIIDGARVPPPVVEPSARLRAINVGRIAAVVGHRRHAPAPTLRNIRQYHRTVSAIAAAVPAILPARFGTLVVEEELSFILRTRAASLRTALKHVRGRVQMTIRIANRGGELTPGTETHEAPALGPKTGRSGSDGPGARYLRNRVSPEDRETRRLLTPLRRSVQGWVHDEQVLHRAGITSVYHLVSRRSAAAYARSLRAAAHKAGLDIVVSGPFPPYAFAATM